MGSRHLWILTFFYLTAVLCDPTKRVTLEMPSEAYLGDSVTVRCVGSDMEDVNLFRDGGEVRVDDSHQIIRTDSKVELRISRVSRQECFDALTCFSLNVSCESKGNVLSQGTMELKGTRRDVELISVSYIIFEDSVIMACDVENFQKFQWLRRSSDSDSHPEIISENVTMKWLTVSRGGHYSCRGISELITTEESNIVNLLEFVSNRAVVKHEPARTEVFSGESLTLRCDVEDEGGSEWSYDWMKDEDIIAIGPREYTLSNVSVSDSGEYSCRAMRETYQITPWSEDSWLQVLSKPVPVLSVSPLWLSPGASVSLKCNVTAPSAGWRFYWYRAVPLPSGSYSYELLPGLTSGTAHGSFTVHSLSSTAGFVCRASRGSPEVYTEYSPPQFVWSADAGSRVSPIVSLNSSQHFTFDLVLVSCGSSDEDWRVQMFSLSNLSQHRCPFEHECIFATVEEIWAVFWCESGRGEMTDAVNITTHDSVILQIPAGPDPEGHSLSLTCRISPFELANFSLVHFYKDGQLIQEGSLRTYSISALSKSDEGLYKCGIRLTSDQVLTSPESWLSVRSPERRSSSVFVLVLVGGVCLAVSLLLLWHYRNIQDLFVRRSQETNQTPPADHVTTTSPHEEKTPGTPADKTV